MPTSEEELILAREKIAEKNINLMNEAANTKIKINCIDVSFAGGIDGNQITDQIIAFSEVKAIICFLKLKFNS